MRLSATARRWRSAWVVQVDRRLTKHSFKLFTANLYDLSSVDLEVATHTNDSCLQ